MCSSSDYQMRECNMYKPNEYESSSMYDERGNVYAENSLGGKRIK